MDADDDEWHTGIAKVGERESFESALWEGALLLRFFGDFFGALLRYRFWLCGLLLRIGVCFKFPLGSVEMMVMPQELTQLLALIILFSQLCLFCSFVAIKTKVFTVEEMYHLLSGLGSLTVREPSSPF